MTNASLRIALLGLALSASAAHAAPAVQADKLYQANCAQCHGAQMEGAVGPALADSTWIHREPTKANLARLIARGVPDKGMPAWAGTLNAAQIAALADHVAPRKAAAKPAPAPAASAGAKDNSLLAGFRLQKGFKISVYADNVPTARAMAVSDSGVVYVGSRKAGKIYALVDENKDNVADKIVTVAEGLESPIGVTLLNGALYVAEFSRVLRFDNIDKSYAAKPQYKVVKDDLPSDKWHGEKSIKAGPDGKLYVPVGAPCNVCDKEDEVYSKIWRMNPDGTNWELVAKGVRNAVGLAWHPVTQELWFTDNGRDEMGDNTPSCELNVAPKTGMHFGFPYCHGGVVPDPKFGAGRNCSEFTPPVAKLGPHVAPLGLAFYTGKQFPAHYRNNLLIAEHGSWNRTTKSGYRISLVTLQGNQEVTTTTFIDGFLQGDNAVARPVDLAQLADGSILISDDHGGKIYRISYQP